MPDVSLLVFILVFQRDWLNRRAYARLSRTSILLRVALEYGQTICAF